VTHGGNLDIVFSSLLKALITNYRLNLLRAKLFQTSLTISFFFFNYLKLVQEFIFTKVSFADLFLLLILELLVKSFLNVGLLLIKILRL